MNGTQFDLSYRLRPEFGASQFVELCQTVLDSLVFDEEVRLELMLEKNTGERNTLDLTAAELSSRLPDSAWPDLHLVQVSNQWIKGMNVKISLVRRPDHQQVTLRGETSNAEHKPLLERRVAAQLGQEQEKERERLFGSMLMTPEIVEATRQAFLAGHFSEAMSAASQQLQQRLVHLLRRESFRPGEVVALFAQDPPRVLLPHLAGSRLKQELEALGHLCAGALSLRADAPAQVLKSLVLVGMLLERLENAIPNPAAAGGPAARKKALRRGGTTKTTRQAAGKGTPRKRTPKAAVRKK